MAAAQGYIGRNPADSSTVIARQSFSPTGIQTDFTFAAGYSVGYVDLYLNGSRLIEGQDFTATDGSTVGLTTNAVNGDVLEVVAFKAFNATNVTTAAGNFTVGGTLDVTGASTLSGNTTVGTGITLDTNGNVNVSGVLTANSFVGDGTQLTGVGGGSVISGITIREEGSVVGTSGTVVNVNFVGADVTATAQAGFSTITIAGGGKFINFTDGGSTGITTTAKTKIQNDFNVTGVSTFGGNVDLGDSDRLRLGAGNDLQIYHDGTINRIRFDVNTVFEKNDSEDIATFLPDGAVTLFHNGTARFETTSSGINVTGITTATELDIKDSSSNEPSLKLSTNTATNFFSISRSSSTGHYTFASEENGSRIIFSTDPDGNGTQERLTIDRQGHVGINTVPSGWEAAADTTALQIDGASVACINDTDFFATSNAYWDGSNWKYIQTGEAVSYYQYNDGRKHIFRSAASGSPGNNVSWTNQLEIDIAGNLDITGIATATQFDATSDVTLKENIAVIDEPITKLSELKGVTFDWKKGGHSVGVIAQDVEKVLPTAVGGSKDQKTVNYNAIIGLLVESVKDQQKQIEELKSLLDK
jgi:hypothetical protein